MTRAGVFSAHRTAPVVVPPKGWRAIRLGPVSLHKAVVNFAALLAVLLPFMLYVLWDDQATMRRVPKPLRSEAIEYRSEQSWGHGAPDDPRSGYLVFRLADDSLRWAQARGPALAMSLEGGDARWHATPVRRNDRNAAPLFGIGGVLPSIASYLGRRGHMPEVDPDRLSEANDALHRDGALFAIDPRGTITIVDPRSGKVYFAYSS